MRRGGPQTNTNILQERRVLEGHEHGCSSTSQIGRQYMQAIATRAYIRLCPVREEGTKKVLDISS
jgi:hypothetical protein